MPDVALSRRLARVLGDPRLLNVDPETLTLWRLEAADADRFEDLGADLQAAVLAVERELARPPRPTAPRGGKKRPSKRAR